MLKNDVRHVALKIKPKVDKDPNKVTYLVEYNYNESIAEDFLEAAVQRFPQEFLDGLKISKWIAFTRLMTGNDDQSPYCFRTRLLSHFSNSIIGKIVKAIAIDTSQACNDKGDE